MTSRTHTKRHLIEFYARNSLRRCLGVGFALGAHCFGAATAIAADADSNTVNLRWHRAAGAEACAEQTKLEELVSARLGRDPFSSDAARILDASISSDAGTWHVELRVRERERPGASLGQRIFDVRAESCDRVVDAVSLAVALAIDPKASLTIDPKSPDIEPTDAATADAAPGDKKDEPGDNAEPKPLPSPYPYAQLLAPIQPACPTPSAWSTRFALRGVAAAGLLPGIAPGVELAASLTHAHSHPSLGISYFAEAALDPRFTFGLTTFNIGYCHDIVTTRRIAVGLCAEAHLGAQRVVVKQLQPLKPGDHLFAAASLGPTFDWLAWGPLYLEAGVTAWLPIPGAHPSFYISGQSSPVFESHSLSGLAFLGAGLMTN